MTSAERCRQARQHLLLLVPRPFECWLVRSISGLRPDAPQAFGGRRTHPVVLRRSDSSAAALVSPASGISARAASADRSAFLLRGLLITFRSEGSASFARSTPAVSIAADCTLSSRSRSRYTTFGPGLRIAESSAWPPATRTSRGCLSSAALRSDPATPPGRAECPAPGRHWRGHPCRSRRAPVAPARQSHPAAPSQTHRSSDRWCR